MPNDAIPDTGFRPKDAEHLGSTDTFPLSDIQKAYYVGRQGVHDLSSVGIHFYFEVEGPFDYDRLNKAWIETVRRHPMLRAHVVGDGRQRIKDADPPDITPIDMTESSEAECAKRLAELRQRFSHITYRPEDWPLFQLLLCQMPSTARLLISIDGLNIDLSSSILVFSDFEKAYHGETLPPPPTYTFAAYVRALESTKETEDYQRACAYWKDRMPALPAAPDLPQRQRPDELETQRFARAHARLPAERWARLKTKATDRAIITPSTLLLAAFADVLRGWAADPDFTLNVTAFNRLPVDPEVAHIAGDFTSMFFIEASEGHDTFEARAAAIQRQVWVCLQHRTAAGPEALRALRAAGGVAPRRAAFPVVFTSALSLDGGTGLYGALGRLGQVTYALTQTPQVSLDYQAHETDGALDIVWDYVTGLFPDGLPEAMLSCYVAFLEALADTEKAWQAQHPVWFGDADRRLQDAMNATAAPVPQDTLQGLFTARAAAAPDRVAVTTPTSTLTYARLHTWANAIATTLIGAKADTPTERRFCILIEKGTAQVAAVWGALFAGGAYVPLDIKAPETRLRDIIADAAPAAILCVAADRARAEALAGTTTVVCVDTLEPLANTPDTALAIQPPPMMGTPGDLAYMIYTSGSTGRPKGVAIEQVSVVNRMTDVVARYGITAQDTAFAISALHHDLSVFDLFGMLAVAGGGLAMPAPEDVRNPPAWVTLIDQTNASVWNSVPAFADMLCEHMGARRSAVQTASLRLFVLSGDWIPPSLPDRLRRVASRARVIGSGGPTETTVWDIFYPVGTVDPAWRSIPYGRPLTNARYYVMDDRVRSRPAWAVGELCIAGTGLARGYWKRPDLTEERFITHPDTGERLYRSGDLGYMDGDGLLHIAGRKDFQIKVNGERIEAGEVEAALNSHAAVQDSLVTAVPGPAGRPRLVGYVRLATPIDARSGEVPIDGVELTENGDRVQFKLERLAVRDELRDLPAVALESAGPLAAFAARSTRFTTRQFAARHISRDDIGRLLGALTPLVTAGQAFPKYAYGSAGGLYPVQTYVQIRGEVEGLAEGFYYFHPFDQRLYQVADSAATPEITHAGSNAATVAQASAMLYLVSREDAMRPMYGVLTRDFCLLEAGYISQLLMEWATPLGLGLCALGVIHAPGLADVLRLGPDQELLHTFACGPLPLDQSEDVIAAPPVSADRLARIRQHVARRVPAHMVPSTLTVVEDWPRNAAGKLDRRRLPAPTETDSPLPAFDPAPVPMPPPASAQPATTAPTTAFDEAICAAFREVLGIAHFGPDDRYRDAGADSLTLVRVHRRLRDATGRDVPLRALFEAETPRALHQMIDQEGA